MSAVYEEVKRKAMRQQVQGFATMYGEPAEPMAGIISEYSSSTVGQDVGSTFLTGPIILYAQHGEPHEMGDRAKILPVRGERLFPLFGQSHTSTMSLGSAWVAAEPEVYNGGVVRLPWARRVICSGKVRFKTAQLPRRLPRTLVGDFLDDEGNG